MKTDKEFVNTLEDHIRKQGAPTGLLSDQAQAQISNRVQDILRTFIVRDWQSEPKRQHQNSSERRYQTAKRLTNKVMDRTGSPAYTWLLALTYICFILNHTAHAILNNQTPKKMLTGQTTDISPLLRFFWWEEVYYKIDDASFPSQSREEKGHFVGFSETVGHVFTYKILTPNLKIIHRSNVRTAMDPLTQNLRTAKLLDDEDETLDGPTYIWSHEDAVDTNSGKSYSQLTPLDPDNLVG